MIDQQEETVDPLVSLDQEENSDLSSPLLLEFDDQQQEPSHSNSEQSTSLEKKNSSPTILSNNIYEKDDFATKYCKFISKFHTFILAVTLILILPTGYVSYPRFLRSTDASMHPIPGSQSDEAVKQFRDAFGPKSGMGLLSNDPMNPGIFAYLKLNSTTTVDSLIDGQSDSYVLAKNYSLGLDEYLSQHLPVSIEDCFEEGDVLPSVNVKSFYSLTNDKLYNSAAKMTNKDGTSTILSITFNVPSCLYNTTNPSHNVQQTYGYKILDLIDSFNSNYTTKMTATNITMGYTGMLPFRKDMTLSLSRDMRRMHFIVLPLALLLFVYGLEGHLLLVVIPLMCILTIISTWCTIMNGVIETTGIQITQFTPNVMITLTFGLGIDYNLFLLSRVLSEFKSLLSIQGSTIVTDNNIKEYSIIVMVRQAGHTVLVSGITLLSTFLGLEFLPITSIRSVSLGASISIFVSIVVTLVLIPSLLYSSFGTHILDLCASESDDTFLLSLKNVKSFFHLFPGNKEEGESSDDSEIESIIDDDEVYDYTSFRDLLQNSRVDDGYSGLDNSEHVIAAINADQSLFSATLDRSDSSSKFKTWDRLAHFICHKGRAAFLIIVVMVVFVPFAIQSKKLHTSLALEKILPRQSGSFKTLQEIRQDYGYGTVAPYRLVFSAVNGKRIDTREGFRVLQTVMQTLEEASDTTTANCTSIAWANNKPIAIETLSLAKECQKFCPLDGLRELAALYFSSTSDDGLNTVSQCVLSDDPYRTDSIEWLENARFKLQNLYFNQTVNDFDFKLSGGASIEIDSSSLLTSAFFVTVLSILSIVSILIALFLRSILSPLRSLATIILTTTCSYGFLSTVSQNAEISWLTPIMSFPVIIGLAVDYDVFLTTRVLEATLDGTNHLDSIKIGIKETGHIITAAGLVMATSFGGLLLSETALVREWAFVLVSSVLLDTFVTRALVAPSLMVLTGHFCWWPRKFQL